MFLVGSNLSSLSERSVVSTFVTTSSRYVFVVIIEEFMKEEIPVDRVMDCTYSYEKIIVSKNPQIVSNAYMERIKYRSYVISMSEITHQNRVEIITEENHTIKYM